jgi:iron complex transport system ATP-binding protein
VLVGRAAAGAHRALFGAHPLLLFDEPAAGLDLPARERLFAAMTSAATGPDAPRTVLATHHLEEVPSTVTHAALLTAGRVVDRGPVEAVLTESALSRSYGLDIVVERRAGRWWGSGPLILTTAACVAWGSSLVLRARPPR